jgi:hypothetical protein
VRGAQPVEAAVARRHAHRAACVGAEREVSEAARDQRRRAARRAAGDVVRRTRIERRAVEVVLADQAEGELVGDRPADGARARGEQQFDAHRVGHRGRMRVAPVRVAAAGPAAGDVDQVLDAEGPAGERSACRRWQVDRFDQRAALGGRVDGGRHRTRSWIAAAPIVEPGSQAGRRLCSRPLGRPSNKETFDEAHRTRAGHRARRRRLRRRRALRR